MEAGSPCYINKLASLRFFAAFLVMIYHLAGVIKSQHTLFSVIAKPVYDYGYIGVSIFFVLSGFVISLANDRWKGWSNYLAGRITRIYPPHLIVTLALFTPDIVILMTQQGVGGWLKLISNLTLTQAWSSNTDYFRSLNLVTWSLSVEVSFYVAFIVLRHLRDRWLFALTVVSYLVLIATTLHLHNRWTFDVYWELYVNPIARTPEFLAGMSIFRLYRVGRLPRLWAPHINFPLILSAMIVTMNLVGVYGGMGGTFYELLDYSIVPLPFIVLIMMALLDQRSNYWMHNRHLVLLGESSFALYLIHRPLIGYLNEILGNTSTGSSWFTLIVLIVFIIVPISISVIFYRLIELPITRIVRHHLVTRTA